MYIFYEDKLVWRTVRKIMGHFINSDNVGLIFSRQATNDNWTNIQVTNKMIDNRYHFSYKGIPQQAPLYLYPEKSDQQSLSETTKRTPNLDPKILQQLEKNLGLEFLPEESSPPREGPGAAFTPLNLLDYIYAILHSPKYRETYKEFLKIGFSTGPLSGPSPTLPKGEGASRN